MPRIMDKNYLTEKEAAHRYSRSRVWFESRRKEAKGPPYIKTESTGRILYHLESTDKWFEQDMKEM